MHHAVKNSEDLLASVAFVQLQHRGLIIFDQVELVFRLERERERNQNVNNMMMAGLLEN